MESIRGQKAFDALNYYTNEMMTVPLDPTLTPQENAQHYFNKYNKLKRTYEALTELIEETKAEIDQLESICTFMDLALSEDDLVQVKEELTDAGYIRRRYNGKRVKTPLIRTITAHQTASICMSEKIITKMMS